MIRRNGVIKHIFLYLESHLVRLDSAGTTRCFKTARLLSAVVKLGEMTGSTRTKEESSEGTSNVARTLRDNLYNHRQRRDIRLTRSSRRMNARGQLQFGRKTRKSFDFQ